MIYKEVPQFQLETSPLFKLPVPLMEFISEDSNTSKMNIQITNSGTPVNLTGYTPTLRVMKSDGKYFEQNNNNGITIKTVATGILEIVLSGDSLSAQGLVYCEINFNDGVTDFTTQKFKYLVRSNLNSYSNLASTGLIPLAVALEYAESQRNDAEITRQEIFNQYINKGNYSPLTIYMKNNSVLYNGSTYIALVDNLVGVIPINSNSWQQTSSKGSDGLGSYIQGSFTASVNGTSRIYHNLNYNPSKDLLLAWYQGVPLIKLDNYTENVDNLSINLVDWTISVGEKITFGLWKANN